MSDNRIPMQDSTADNMEPTPATILQTIIRNCFVLGLFAIVAVSLTTMTYIVTQEKIEKQTHAYETKALTDIIPPETHGNILVDTKIMLAPSTLLSNQKTVEAYAAVSEGQISAVILPVIAVNGYNGRIDLLVGINHKGILTGVRAINHKETLGLGSSIASSASTLIIDFIGKSLKKPKTEGWNIKKDGGQFDQLTGATITSRAVVTAVHRALQYFDIYQEQLLNPLNIHNVSKANKHDR